MIQAKDLSNLLNCKRVRDAGRYIPKRGQTVVNWGLGRAPSWMDVARTRGVRILNNPSAVNTASNKLSTFRALEVAGVVRTLQGVAGGGDRTIDSHFARHFNHQATPYPTHPPLPINLANNKMKIVELILYNKFYCKNIFYVNFV